MKLRYKLNWKLWDWAARKRLSASRRGKHVQEGGKSRPHVMSIYPLSLRARTDANSPYNRLWWHMGTLSCRKQRLPCLFGASLDVVAVPHFSYRAPQHTAAAYCCFFISLAHSTHALLKSHPGKRLCSTKELILTCFPASITPFSTTVGTILAPCATGPALEEALDPEGLFPDCLNDLPQPATTLGESLPAAPLV